MQAENKSHMALFRKHIMPEDSANKSEKNLHSVSWNLTVLPCKYS